MLSHAQRVLATFSLRLIFTSRVMTMYDKTFPVHCGNQTTVINGEVSYRIVSDSKLDCNLCSHCSLLSLLFLGIVILDIILLLFFSRNFSFFFYCLSREMLYESSIQTYEEKVVIRKHFLSIFLSGAGGKPTAYSFNDLAMT